MSSIFGGASWIVVILRYRTLIPALWWSSRRSNTIWYLCDLYVLSNLLIWSFFFWSTLLCLEYPCFVSKFCLVIVCNVLISVVLENCLVATVSLYSICHNGPYTMFYIFLFWFQFLWIYLSISRFERSSSIVCDLTSCFIVT